MEKHKKKVNIIGNKYFEGVEEFLRLYFKRFEIISALYVKGKSQNMDGCIGYSTKPSLEIIVTPKKRKYRFKFYLDSNFMGDFWWWIIEEHKENGVVKRSTNYFYNSDTEKVKEVTKEYKKSMYKYIVK